MIQTDEIVSYQSIARAEALIHRPADGTPINESARQGAKNHLLVAAGKLETFASLKPESDAAQFLYSKAVELRITAAMA